MVSPVYALSALERKLWKENSFVSLLSIFFLAVVRINGIVFLIYLGIQGEWWHPVVLWIACLIMTPVAMVFFRGPTGLAWPSLAGFVVIPVVAVFLWIIA